MSAPAAASAPQARTAIGGPKREIPRGTARERPGGDMHRRAEGGR
jgi:hypothetical protein